MSGEGPKRPCLIKKIGTHNGTFHCDEALACFMLKQLPEFLDAQIVRSRDPAVLDKCDMVVDVGGVYDPEKGRLDHHQRTFSETMNSLNPSKKWVTKLSSAGLVYNHFGHRVVAGILGTTPDAEITQTIYDKVYEMFVEEIDAVDNGISQTDEKPRYAITTTLSARVGHLNPAWNEQGADPDAQFMKAMALVGSELIDRVQYFYKSWWPAREIVVAAVNKRHEIDPSGEIIAFESGGCPWKDHLFTLEEELGITPGIKFSLFADQSGNWRVQCVPVQLGSFENRLSLLEEWRGVRDDELSQLSGIPGCIFVHASGFIGGNKTYEGALEMARRTLQGKPRPES